MHVRRRIQNVELHLKLRLGIMSKLLAPETMKLFGSTEKNESVNKNTENVPRLEVSEALLVHCKFVNNNYQ